MSRKVRCPRCGSTELKRVVYGKPDDPELLRLWGKGEVMIRPRQATDAKASGWMCDVSLYPLDKSQFTCVHLPFLPFHELGEHAL
jgi:hypothetical protein